MHSYRVAAVALLAGAVGEALDHLVAAEAARVLDEGPALEETLVQELLDARVRARRELEVVVLLATRGLGVHQVVAPRQICAESIRAQRWTRSTG